MGFCPVNLGDCWGLSWDGGSSSNDSINVGKPDRNNTVNHPPVITPKLDGWDSNHPPMVGLLLGCPHCVELMTVSVLKSCCVFDWAWWRDRQTHCATDARIPVEYIQESKHVWYVDSVGTEIRQALSEWGQMVSAFIFCWTMVRLEDPSGHSEVEGYYRIKGSTEFCIERAIAFAPYADSRGDLSMGRWSDWGYPKTQDMASQPAGLQPVVVPKTKNRANSGRGKRRGGLWFKIGKSTQWWCRFGSNHGVLWHRFALAPLQSE